MGTDGGLNAMGKKINNKGVVVVYVAIGIIVLIGFVGLAVDLGYMYVVKGQLQNAADAAALAGAAKLDGTTSTIQTDARTEAVSFALKNKAAGQDVTIDPNAGNAVTGDVVVGNWDPSRPQSPQDLRFLPTADGSNPLPAGAEINAVKVVARRTGESPDTGIAPSTKVSLFFGKIIGWGIMGVKSQAIAALELADIMPAVVNEYWKAKDTESSQRPYVPPYTPEDDHVYPNSFVRKKIVTDRTTASLAYGKIFAVLGNQANTAMPSSCGPGSGGANINGYVNLDVRNTRYRVANDTWYRLRTGAAASSDCSAGCIGTPPAGFNGPLELTQGDVDNDKFGISLQYVYGGYPDNYMLPTAIREQGITPVDYPCGTEAIYATPSTSNCPYATVAYFSGSGNPPIQNTVSPFNGKGFAESFPPGKKVIAMVYDGTYRLASGNGPNGVTIVGYVLLQIDGYSSTNPRNLNLTLTPNDLSPTQGSTLYAHAISDIVEPSPPGGIGGCDETLIDNIHQLRVEGATPKLVK